jgi:hypothetical protein
MLPPRLHGSLTIPEQDAFAWYQLGLAPSTTVHAKGSLVWSPREQWSRDSLAIQRTQEALTDAVRARRSEVPE